MVYVPILKIDLPEPRLQELIPGLVTAVLGACTLAYDAVYDLLHPLSPEGEEALYAATLMHMPKEFRKARRRIVELNIQDEDNMSEEMETAAYNFYRRRMREEVCGYSDEEVEDVTFRRLMTPDSATRDIYGLTPLDVAVCERDAEVFQQLVAGPSTAAAAAAVAPPPGRVRRATVTTAVGGAGLALGAGVVKLVHFVSSRLQKQRRKAKRRAAAAAGQAGSRRQSEQGGAAAAAAVGARGSRRSSTGTGRVTPRQR